MSHSGRRRHRDAAPGHRHLAESEPQSPHRIFRITDAQRQKVMESLRYIDDARSALEDQQRRENREIIRELRASADDIFDLLDSLEEIAG